MTYRKLALALLGAWTLPLFGLSATLLASAASPLQDSIPPAKQQPAGAKDLHGDPLPAGALARLGTVRLRHGKGVGFIAFLPDGKQVLSGGDDRAIRLWDFATGQEIRRFGPNRPRSTDADGFADDPDRIATFTAALSHDGKTLAAHFDRAAIQLWDVATGNTLPSIAFKDPDERMVCALAFAPHAPHLAGTTPDGQIHIWDTVTGKELRAFPTSLRANFTANGHLAFSPDGKVLMWIGLDEELNTIVTFWDPATGKKRNQLPLDVSRFFCWSAFSPDGERVAVATDEGKIYLFDLATGRELWSQSAYAKDRIALARFSADGKKLFSKVVGRPPIQEWDAATGKKLRLLGLPEAPAENTLRTTWAVSSVCGMALSPDGKTLAIGDEGNTIRFLDLASGKYQPLPDGHRARIKAVSFTPDGKSLLTQGGRPHVCWWDPATGRLVKNVAAPNGAKDYCSSADGRLLAVLGQDHSITLQETAGGKILGKIPGQPDSDPQVLFAPDGRTLLVSRTEVALYDTSTGKERCQIAGPTLVPQAVFIVDLPLPAVWFFSPDSRLLVGFDNGWTMWDVATGKVRQKIALPKGQLVRGGAVSANNRMLALDLYDGRVALWELASGKQRCQFAFKAPPEMVLDWTWSRSPIAFSPDGKLLAHAANGDPLNVWDVCSGHRLAEFQGHQGTITALAFAPDGCTLVSGSWDTTALIWDVKPARKKAGGPLRTLDAAAVALRWDDLASDDAAKAWTAVCALAGSPKQTLSFFQVHLQPSPPLDAGQVQSLLKQLDSTMYKERQQAEAGLAKLGDRVVPALEKALAAKPSLETRKRLEGLVARLTAFPMPKEQARIVRAVEVLEYLDTPEARQLLQRLAEGAPGALATITAREALKLP